MQIDFNLLIQGFIVVIIIGVFYSLISTSKIYGGVIGAAIRFFGLGTMFVTLGIIERILVDLQIVEPAYAMTLVQHLFDLLGIAFLGLGFAKLAAGLKV